MRSLIVQGLLAILPLSITAYLTFIIFRFIENIVENVLLLFPDFIINNTLFIVLLEIITFIFLLLMLALFGRIVRTIIGKSILKLIQSFFSFIPGLNVVYRAINQIVTILSSEKRSFYKHPVLVEYPSSGIWTIAFNTGEIDMKDALPGEKFYTIFIPTTPNPTSGFLAIMSKSKIRDFEIPVVDAIKLILTGGIVKTDPEEREIIK
jgi:uncharacterized membrane protein